MSVNLQQHDVAGHFPYVVCSGLFTEAEKEMSAFLTAVTEVHGSQCAQVAAGRWIETLEEACLPAEASEECFRRVTLATVASLSCEDFWARSGESSEHDESAAEMRVQ